MKKLFGCMVLLLLPVAAAKGDGGCMIPNVEITSPTVNSTVNGYTITVTGLGTKALWLTVTLQSSKCGIPDTSGEVQIDLCDGGWIAIFHISDPADYPGDSTVIATVTNTQVSTLVTFKIRP